jgi:hypothetical protein
MIEQLLGFIALTALVFATALFGVACVAVHNPMHLEEACKAVRLVFLFIYVFIATSVALYFRATGG